MQNTQAVNVKIEANVRPALFTLNLIVESGNAVEFNATRFDSLASLIICGYLRY